MAGGDDPLISPTQASITHALRRALATSMQVSDQYNDQTGLTELMKDNLAGRLSKAKSGEFGEGLAASALISLHVFANMASFLLSSCLLYTSPSPRDRG